MAASTVATCAGRHSSVRPTSLRATHGSENGVLCGADGPNPRGARVMRVARRKVGGKMELDWWRLRERSHHRPAPSSSSSSSPPPSPSPTPTGKAPVTIERSLSTTQTPQRADKPTGWRQHAAIGFAAEVSAPPGPITHLWQAQLARPCSEPSPLPGRTPPAAAWPTHPVRPARAR